MPKSILTQDRLRALLHYEPETGIVTRLAGRKGVVQAGTVVGCLFPNGYLYISVDGARYLAHRLAFFYMYGRWPNEVDHANGVRNDNRLVNLREVTRTEQNKNMARRTDNTSGHTGVHFSKAEKKWHARIKVNSKLKHLGYFPALEDAVAARKAAEKLYGFHPNHGREPTRPQVSQPAGPSLVRASQATPPLKPRSQRVQGS